MFDHHKKAIETVTSKLKQREEVLGVIIGGSIAHGFANEQSDIDLFLVLSDENYEKSLKTGDINYFETESTPYEGGYVDGKCTSVEAIKKVALCGSEPTRFAFKDAFVTYSRIEGLQQLVDEASRYPVENKAENMEKFYAQFEAWKWYFQEGLQKGDRYLMEFSIANFVLFAGRLILAYNEALFPYHKWFLRVLEGVPNKPDGLLHQIRQVLEIRDRESVEALYNSIAGFHRWSVSEKHWSIRFMLDSELNWMKGWVPVADL